MSNTRRVKIQDLLFDRQNANKGTPRGQYMLDTSIDQYGAGRSILIDKDGEIIAGNKTLQAWADAGYDDVLVIETDGKTLVAVQRGDMDLDDPSTKARELAYADNRASEVSLAWDADQILADMQAGIDLSGMFLEDELNELLKLVSSEPFIPELTEKQEPEIEYDHLIEVYASGKDFDAIAKIIKEWAVGKDVKINIS